MKKYRIKLNDKVYEVEIEEVTGSLGEIAAESSHSSKSTQKNNVEKSLNGITIEAPIPGSILGVYVKVGDQVKKDQLLVTLEAMKMENEIVSPVDVKVISIGVSIGDSVKAGHVLLQLG